MEKRSYKKFTELYPDLIDYCAEMGKKQLRQLPHERELAEQLGASRMTLRKTLQLAIGNGVLKRVGRFLEVAQLRHNISKLGKILFVSTGVDGKITLRAFEDIYSTLEPELKRMGGDIELLLTNNHTPLREIRSKCMKSDIILLTLFLSDEPDCDRLRFFQEISHHHKVISLSDPYQEHFPNFIALDNYAAGELAARALLNAGCRKVGCVSHFGNNIIWNKRKDGFCDYLREVGMEYCSNDSSLPRKEQFEHALAAGCDGVFLITDEEIDKVTSKAFAESLVPQKVKLIAVNGSGQARRHRPEISSVSHASREVAVRLTEYLVQLSENPDWPNCRQLIVPQLYPGKTLFSADVEK